MTRNIDHEIQQCRSRIGQLEEELREKKSSLSTLELEAAERDHGIKVGVVVVTRKGRFIVARILTRVRSKPAIYGRPFKKDGTPAAVERWISSGDWTLETTAEAVS